VAKELHRRLLDDALAALGGTVQSVVAAYNRIDEATARMTAAAMQAEASIQQWQNVTLRRVWTCAFGTCAIVTFLCGILAWLIRGGH